MISHSICPLCSSGSISLYLRCNDHFLSREEFELFKCSSCGFVFTREYPDGKEMGRYYESDDYISHDDNAKGFMNMIYLFARNIMLRKKLRIVRNATGLVKGRLLDVGCGTGYFAAIMKKYGWEVTGIEPGIKAREFASKMSGINVINPEQISSLQDNSFDTVTMWHVMEHLHDPFKYADEVSRLLKPGGIWITAMPNCMSADAAHYGRFWAAWDVPRHLWHYNPHTLSVFAKKTGFRINKLSTLPLDVFYISILSEKYKGTGFPFLKGTLKGSLFAFQSLSDKEKSSSLIYLLQ